MQFLPFTFGMGTCGLIKSFLLQILASAELLSETELDHSQASFLQTVQACGMSLVETVNHVLDFTKLSGNAKAGGVENIIQRSKWVSPVFFGLLFLFSRSLLAFTSSFSHCHEFITAPMIHSHSFIIAIPSGWLLSPLHPIPAFTPPRLIDACVLNPPLLFNPGLI